MIRYLTAEEILIIHALVVEATGGSDGVRDPHLLASIAERSRASFSDIEVHASLFARASALCEAIVNYHVFVDGNKRTGFVALGRFLALNGYDLTATNAEVEDLMVGIATKEVDIAQLCLWIEAHATEL